MKVRDLIATLTTDYDPNDDLVVIWYDRGDFWGSDYNEPPTVEEWRQAVARVDKIGPWDSVSSYVHEWIEHYVDEAVAASDVTADEVTT